VKISASTETGSDRDIDETLNRIINCESCQDRPGSFLFYDLEGIACNDDGACNGMQDGACNIDYARRT
jgi:hypothetical protein